MFEDYFDIDSILSYLKQAPFLSGLDEKAIGALNGLLNLLFGVGKSIVLSGNYVIKHVYSLDILNDSLDKVFSSGEAVWDSLFKMLGVVFLTILFAYGLRDMIRFGINKIFMRLLIFGALFVVATGFYSNGASWLKDMNTISSKAQNDLVAVLAPDVSKASDKLASDLGLTPPTETTDKVENMLYYKFILEPFALFNYGKTDISKAEFTDLTAKKGKYDDDKVNDIDDAVDKKSDKNAYLTGKKLGDKYLILVNSGIDYVIVGGVVLLIAVMNFLVQIFILALVLISPIWAGLALLPDNEHVLINGMKLILGAFGLKIGLGIGFGFIFMILNFIDSAFGLTSIVAIVASLIIKVVLAILVVKNFSWFKHAVTKAEVNGVPDMKVKGSRQEREAEKTRKEVNPDYRFDGEHNYQTGFSNAGGYNQEYADNIQLQSALDETSPETSSTGENIMRGFGYATSRGFGNAVLDKVGDKAKDMYEDSTLQNVVDTSKEFMHSPSDYVKDRISPYASAYSEGQLEGLNKKYGIDSTDQEVRMDGSDEEKEQKQEKVKSYDPNEFEYELASLRGEDISQVDIPVNEYPNEEVPMNHYSYTDHERNQTEFSPEQENQVVPPINDYEAFDMEHENRSFNAGNVNSTIEEGGETNETHT
ncbi:hypothetical protein [Enterococcus faecium]|uniref:hypothetical protein n=1 Tax=Enterococcus faecium TaxID=1352 RepID=UPI001D0E6CED|nr:hypothetical protein [Enterococcus faecium]